MDVDGCTCLRTFCYGLGHVYNDLCAAIWFSYMLFYLQIILEVESTTAGTLVMIGQVADSLATPLAGWAVDRTDSRRAWHLAGTVAVAVGFTLIFAYTPGGATNLPYYALTIILFQVGWAVVQISHLSIIPYMSRDQNHSADLTAIRYTASVCCNIAVYVVTLLILRTDQTANQIGPSDLYKFKEIALIITAVGVTSSLTFYAGAKTVGQEKNLPLLNDRSEKISSLNDNGRRHLLGSWGIYQVSLMYMSSRLFTALNLIFIPLYLDENANNAANNRIRETIATVPLVCFVSSFVTSIVMKYRNSKCSDKVAYLLGSILSVTGCIWILTGGPNYEPNEIYGVASLIGMGSSATMVASLCMTASYAKTNDYGGGSVYSAVTFMDKLVSGAVVVIIQHMQCEPRQLCPYFYQNVLGYVCGGTAILGVLSLLLYHKNK